MLYSAPIPYVSDASGYYAAIGDLSWPMWLDSAGLDRYDILCAQPAVTLVARGSVTEICDKTGVRHSDVDPFELIRQELGAPRSGEEGVPFAGGALGYWGYDLRRPAIVLPEQKQAGFLPDMAVGIYDWAVVLDHKEKTAQLVSWQEFPETEAALPGILERLRQGREATSAKFRVRGKITSDFAPDSYAAAFAKVQAYLHAGDCYQVNLAQRFSAEAEGDALAAYHGLRAQSPAPFSAFLNYPWAQVLCASPERFLRVKGGKVETRPIKGTRPRGGDEQEDRQLAVELGRHPKDRAENLMIVDLLRNDLGKSCVPGSVSVPRLFEVESFASVHHLVSTVEGRLGPGKDALHVLRDCFPGGSVTGAPKQRAMQIIAQLEPHARGIYCGAIGYAGFDGNMDSNIVIRTLVYDGREIECRAGGGIVADSEAGAEYQETLDKAAAMLRILRQFGGE